MGIFFLSLARTSTAAGMWPLIAARVTSITLFGVIAVATGRTLRMSAPAATTAIAGGALDMVANALYMIAARVGPLSIVVTLASLYPASTVILARVVLGERLSVVQGARNRLRPRGGCDHRRDSGITEPKNVMRHRLKIENMREAVGVIDPVFLRHAAIPRRFAVEAAGRQTRRQSRDG